jgi:hypothetical protein
MLGGMIADLEIVAPKISHAWKFSARAVRL